MERSKPLHNFRLPCLKWGNQRLLRCMKVNSNGEISAVDCKSAFDSTRFVGPRGSSDRRRDIMKPFCKKLMFDFQTEVGKMKDAILREGLEEPTPPPAVESPAEIEAARPWNLRTRRAACKAPPHPVNGAGGGKNLNDVVVVSKHTSSLSPLRIDKTVKREREKFCVSLSRSELEEDFMTMAGRRLHRKPKKRPKIVQKQLDTLFPGLWLTEINADLYRVPDDPETGKR